MLSQECKTVCTMSPTAMEPCSSVWPMPFGSQFCVNTQTHPSLPPYDEQAHGKHSTADSKKYMQKILLFSTVLSVSECPSLKENRRMTSSSGPKPSNSTDTSAANPFRRSCQGHNRTAAISPSTSQVPGKRSALLGQTPRVLFTQSPTGQAPLPPTASLRSRAAGQAAAPRPATGAGLGAHR